MRRILPLAILAVLIVAGVAISLSAGGGGSEGEPSTAVIDPAMLDALEKSLEVEVLVSLKPPDIPAEQRTMELRSQDFAERWARVMDALTESDFEVLIEVDQSAAISGMLTKDGLAVLREHNDVVGGALARGEGVVSATSPAFTNLTGKVSHIVEQIMVDGVLEREILKPVTNGRVSLPGLGASQPLGPDGSFSFRRLELSEIPMMVSVEVQADGYRPTTWVNRLVLYGGLGPNFTLRVEFGEAPMRRDYCSELLAAPEVSLSASGLLHAQLCSELPNANRSRPDG